MFPLFLIEFETSYRIELKHFCPIMQPVIFHFTAMNYRIVSEPISDDIYNPNKENGIQKKK